MTDPDAPVDRPPHLNGPRDEEILINRLHMDLEDGRRSDREVATAYLAKLMGLECSAVHAALAARRRLDGPGPGLSSQAGRAWEDFEPDPPLHRRVAEAIEAQLWQRHGTTRITFEEWRAELLRVIKHERRQIVRPVPRAEQEQAYARRLSPWMYYESTLASAPGSIDDLPSL